MAQSGIRRKLRVRMITDPSVSADLADSPTMCTRCAGDFFTDGRIFGSTSAGGGGEKLRFSRTD